MRILVVGGSGHIGTRIVNSLRENSEFEVSIGGRYPARYQNGTPIRLDQTDSFVAAEPFDVVINCTNTYRLTPVELFEYCIRRGKIYVETTADTDAYLQLFDRYGMIPAEFKRGVALLGLGIFPGLSNILAGEAARAVKNCTSIQLHLSWSVVSGAGPGTCEVMVQTLSRPIRHARNGQIQEASPIGVKQSVSYFHGLTSGFELGLPEAFLLHKSLGIEESSTIVSTRPAMPGFVISLTHTLTRLRVFKPRWIQAILRAGFNIVRTRVLKNRSTDIEMVAVAFASSESTPIVNRVWCDDAFQAAAEVIHSCVNQVTNGLRPQPGIYTADQLFTVPQILNDCRSVKPTKPGNPNHSETFRT